MSPTEDPLREDVVSLPYPGSLHQPVATISEHAQVLPSAVAPLERECDEKMKAIVTSTVDPVTGFFGGIAKYEQAVIRSLRTNGVEVARQFVDTHEGARFGAYMMPMWRQATGSYTHLDGETIHAIQPKTALRGTDVASIHSPMADRSRWHDPRDWVWRALNRQAFKNSRLLTVNTTWDPWELAARYGHAVADRARPVGMSFDPAYHVDAGVRKDVDVLWVGKSTPNKGLRVLHSALELIRDRDSFVVVQSTPHGAFPGEHAWARESFKRMSLRQLPRLLFNERPLPENEIIELFQRSKVIVSTSFHETFHQPIFEAYLCGAAVVLPRRPPYVQIFQSAETLGQEGIYFYDCHEPAEIAESIRSALREHPHGIEPSAALARVYSDKEFGRRLVGVYEEAGPRRIFSIGGRCTG